MDYWGLPFRCLLCHQTGHFMQRCHSGRQQFNQRAHSRATPILSTGDELSTTMSQLRQRGMPPHHIYFFHFGSCHLQTSTLLFEIINLYPLPPLKGLWTILGTFQIFFTSSPPLCNEKGRPPFLDYIVLPYPCTLPSSLATRSPSMPPLKLTSLPLEPVPGNMFPPDSHRNFVGSDCEFL